MDALRYACVETAHGPWWMAWTARGVCATSDGPDGAGRLLRQLAALGAPAAEHAPGERPPDDRIDWRLVPAGFRRDVLAACAAIPRGDVRTYGELAAEAGYPGAARAVGTAMATNPLAPLVPCHRVVKAGGELGRYGAGGTARKAQMLVREGVRVADGGRLGARAC